MRGKGLHGCLVTGTDTGVGKTVLTAAIVAALAAEGVPVRAHKPVSTGLDQAAGAPEPPDHVLLAAAAGMAEEEVAPVRYGPPVSPALAAELSGEPLHPQTLLRTARETAGQATLIVEGIGGLLVPLAPDYSVCDFAVALGLPVVIAARAGLGTINHTLLTLAAARTSGLDVRAVVLTPWPQTPSEVELSNRESIARLGGVAVEVLPVVRRLTPELLAAAMRDLPYPSWIGIARPPSHLSRT